MEVCISKGYVFQMEMLVRANRLGFSVGEVSFTPTAIIVWSRDILYICKGMRGTVCFFVGADHVCGQVVRRIKAGGKRSDTVRQRTAHLVCHNMRSVSGLCKCRECVIMCGF